jgi:hypothetical protein
VLPYSPQGVVREYENYDGNAFLGDDSTTSIIGHKKVKFQLKNGRIRTLLGVFHILEMDRNLISISKMNDASVHTVFEKITYKMI